MVNTPSAVANSGVADVLHRPELGQSWTLSTRTAACRAAAPPETDGDADWWFTRDKDGGAVRGPFRAAEMRRKYRAGSVQETTLVRWLPMLESRPSAEMVDEQAAVKFSPLAELMTAEGPPFT